MSKERLQIIKRYIIYVIGVAILTFVAYRFLLVPQMQIRIIYALGQKTETEEYLRMDIQSIPDSEDGIDGLDRNTITVTSRIDLEDTASKRMFDTFFGIPAIEQALGMEFQLQPRTADKDSRIQIRTIEILNNQLSQKKYSPREIEKLFSYEQVSNIVIEDDRLCITAENDNNVVMKANEKFLSDYNDSLQPSTELLPNLLLMALFMSVLVILLDYYITAKKNKTYLSLGEKKDAFQIVITLLMIVAAACVILMALCSRHYAHPDEDVTRAAIDYYMTHWLPPNMQDVSVLGTFSDYGMTRLNESSLYYLAAGKIGWIFATIFHVNKYYRMLNMLLFIIMLAMLLSNKRRNLWMIIGIGITPQLWYLFSYATSDAWDFFWSFLIIYELLEESSELNRYLTDKSRNNVFAVLSMSFIFSMIFRGKQNYYLILIFTFMALVKKWFEKKNKKRIFVKYMLLVLCSICLLIPRAAIQQYAEKISCEEQRDGEAGGKEQEAYVHTNGMNIVTRREQGYSILDVAIKDGKDIISGLTNSGVGSYGWLEYHNSYWYGFGVTGLYGIVVIFIIYYMIRMRKINGAIDSCILIIMLFLAYFMVVYTCWSSDFQTQGRYVMPLTLVVGYYSMQEKEIAQNKMLQVLISALTIISLVSYIGKGLYNLI